MFMGLYICLKCRELYTNEMLDNDLCPDCGEKVKEFTYDLWNQEEKRLEGVI